MTTRVWLASRLERGIAETVPEKAIARGTKEAKNFIVVRREKKNINKTKISNTMRKSGEECGMAFFYMPVLSSGSMVFAGLVGR